MRRNLFDTGIDGSKHSCPACGYPTLYSRGCVNSCVICTWEDDGQDDADELGGGPNSITLTSAREAILSTMAKLDFPEEISSGEVSANILKLIDESHDENVREMNTPERLMYIHELPGEKICAESEQDNAFWGLKEMKDHPLNMIVIGMIEGSIRLTNRGIDYIFNEYGKDKIIGIAEKADDIAWGGNFFQKNSSQSGLRGWGIITRLRIIQQNKYA